VTIEWFSCCFQQSQIDKEDSNLNYADGICTRQKLPLILVVIILPFSLNCLFFFFTKSKRAMVEKRFLTLSNAILQIECFVDFGTTGGDLATQS
jgi:hypothetical protein